MAPQSRSASHETAAGQQSSSQYSTRRSKRKASEATEEPELELSKVTRAGRKKKEVSVPLPPKRARVGTPLVDGPVCTLSTRT